MRKLVFAAVFFVQCLARWDGWLPHYTLGGGAVPFVQIPVPGEARR